MIDYQVEREMINSMADLVMTYSKVAQEPINLTVEADMILS